MSEKTKKILKDTYFLKPAVDLVKGGVRKGDVDGMAASMGPGDPFDDCDKKELQDLSDMTGGAYGIRVGKTAISIICQGDEVAEVGLPPPPMTLSDLRNSFKEAVAMAKEHARENQSKLQRKKTIDVVEDDLGGGQGEAKGAEGEEVDGNVQQKEEFNEANGEEAQKSFDVDKEFFGDLLVKSDPCKNQGYKKGN